MITFVCIKKMNPLLLTNAYLYNEVVKIKRISSYVGRSIVIKNINVLNIMRFLYVISNLNNSENTWFKYIITEISRKTNRIKFSYIKICCSHLKKKAYSSQSCRMICMRCKQKPYDPKT